MAAMADEWITVGNSAGNAEAGGDAAPAETMATRRLMRDLKNLQNAPLNSVAAQPLEDNLFEWHANVRGTSAPYTDVVFHFILRFPPSYPSRPPSIDLCTTIPHPNVFPNKHGKRNHICMDLTEDGDFTAIGAQQRQGWSSSYTVSTVLLQLQSFLVEAQTAPEEAKVQTAIAAARRFQCPCGHHAEFNIYRPELVNAEAKRETLRVAAPILATASRVRRQKREAANLAARGITSAPAAAQPAVAKTPSAPGADAVKPASATAGPPVATAAPVAPADEWVVFHSRKAVRRQQKQAEMFAPAWSFKKSKFDQASIASTASAGSSKDTPIASPVKPNKPVTKASAIISAPAVHWSIVEHEKSLSATVAPLDGASRSAKRNAARARARAKHRQPEQKQAPQPVAAKTLTAPATPYKLESKPQAASAPAEEQKEDAMDVEENEDEQMDGEDESVRTALAMTSVKGTTPITELPYKVLLTHIFTFLRADDVARLACVNREMHAAAEEGYLWRLLFSRQHPQSELSPSSMRDWKWCFLLESAHVVQDLVCFHSRASYEETVLGMPLDFTMNPKTNQVDYIEAFPDLLSCLARHVSGIRTPLREKFIEWIPIYITEDHFERALPFIRASILKLSPGQGSYFKPEMVLDVLPKMLNTLTVLLCDKGVHASERVADVFCALHRLFIALAHRFPVIQTEADRRIRNFINSEESRVKERMPNIGHFLWLLAVSDKYKWQHVAQLYFMESTDRNVLWNCRKFPELAVVPAQEDANAPADMQRLEKTLTASVVSLRLAMFHAYFLTRFTSGTTDDMADRYDRFFGRPSHAEKRAFRESVQSILNADTWPKVFAHLHLVCPTPQKLSVLLRGAVRRSLKKRYHSAGMDFTAVHASGVSRILLKGESISAPPDMKTVVFEDSWSWHAGDGTQFLDATVFLYEGKRMKEWADFSKLQAGPAVTHSGDVINHEKLSGNHRITVALHALPPKVDTLVFALTSYTTTLARIRQPWVKFSDVKTGHELCRYSLEDQKTGSNTAVTMCTMSRNPLRPSQWTVTAVGKLSMGRATGMSCYKPLLDEIQKHLP